MELSIIMINYNTPELTAQAVESTVLKTKASAAPAIWALKRQRDQSFCF